MVERNKAVLRRFSEQCWGRGFFDDVDELVAEDVVRNGHPIGRAGLIAVIKAIRAALPDFHTQTEDLFGEGDRVGWRYASAGTHTGAALLGVPVTGEALSWTGTAIVRLRDGRIQEIWDNVDLLAIY